MSSRKALGGIALAALLIVPTGARGATPIEQVPSELTGLQLFSGEVATPQSVKAPKPPRHPLGL